MVVAVVVVAEKEVVVKKGMDGGGVAGRSWSSC